MAVVPHPGGTADPVVTDSKVHVVDDEQVEMTIAVEVEKSCARPPTGVVHPRSAANFGKGAVALVPVESIAAEVRHEQVREAVVVVVARGDPHPVAAVTDAGLIGDIFESRRISRPGRRENIPVEAVFRCLARPERAALHEIGVEVTVVVVVEEGAAASHDLGQVELAGGAAPVHEVKPGLGRDLAKIGGALLIRRGALGRCCRAAAPNGEDQAPDGDGPTRHGPSETRPDHSAYRSDGGVLVDTAWPFGAKTGGSPRCDPGTAWWALVSSELSSKSLLTELSSFDAHTCPLSEAHQHRGNQRARVSNARASSPTVWRCWLPTASSLR